MYPSSNHIFSPIGMKLGMDTPWDPGGDMGFVSSPLGHCATRLRVMGQTFFFHFYAFQSILSRLRHTIFFFKNFCVRVSEHFESYEIHFFFNFLEREAQNERKRSEQDVSTKCKARGSEATQ